MSWIIKWKLILHKTMEINVTIVAYFIVLLITQIRKRKIEASCHALFVVLAPLPPTKIIILIMLYSQKIHIRKNSKVNAQI